MEGEKNILTDSFGRGHTYLRISITERCNLRCTYCMPAEGIELSPKSNLMTGDEIYTIAKVFVDYGITKIRLTGGEPLVRKDAKEIIEKLATLPTALAITTNAVLVDRFLTTFKRCGIRHVNVSLDSLDAKKYRQITRRNYFDRVYNNILLLLEEGFTVKINVVLIRGFNDSEIVDFIRLTELLPVTVRFIEFMPFDGNKWNIKKMLPLEEVLGEIATFFPKDNVLRRPDALNDTSKNYKIKGYKGSFAIISSVTAPFCDSCNRLRLTADGQLKNCLFSAEESDLLTAVRKGSAVDEVIRKTIHSKLKIRGGMDTLKKLKTPERHLQNRSMIAIGG